MIKDEYNQPIEYYSQTYDRSFDEYGQPDNDLEFSTDHVEMGGVSKTVQKTEEKSKTTRLLKSQMAAMLTTSTLVFTGLVGPTVFADTTEATIQACRACSGAGIVDCPQCEDGREICPQCDGTGVDKMWGGLCGHCFGELTEVCHRCGGVGYDTCGHCDGTGVER